MLWLAVAVPLVVMVQIGLVTLRNVIRRRIHEPHVVDDRPSENDDLAAIIVDALEAVIDRVPRLRDTDAVLAAADATSRRVAARATLTARQQRTLHRELEAALLETFAEQRADIDRLQPVDLRRVVVEDLP